MTGCSTIDMLVNKSSLDPIIPLLTPPLLPLAILLSLDPYQFHLDYLDPLLSVSVHHPLSQKHDDNNGGGNSSKKNSLKNCSKGLVKTLLSSRQLTLEVESMIQRSSKGVMLQFSYLLDTCINYLCRPSPSLFHIIHALPSPSP